MPCLDLIVAEDDDDLRKWLTLVLRPLGARVREARTGAELLRLLFDGAPADLVITDVRMPPPDGLEVLAKVRAVGLDIPFLVISAFADDEVRSRASGLGAEVLAKPFPGREILGRVRDLAAGRGR